MFMEAYPYYLAVGCSYDEYWNSPAWIAQSIMAAHQIKRKMQNEELWLQGYYTFAAVSTALSNIHLDGKKRKPNLYLDKPFDIFEKTDEEKRLEAIKEREKAVQAFNAMKLAWQKNK